MRRRGIGGTLIIALAFVAFALVKRCNSRTINPVTGTVEYVSMTPEQEVQMGLASRGQLAQQFGGLYPDEQTQNLINQIGNDIVSNSDAARSPYTFEFHVLNDPQTVNAFALPGGQVFITTALLNQLKSQDQIAGVLGHEIGHVIERHSAERIADSEFFGMLGNAAVIATGDASTQQVASAVINSSLMANGRKDELESDELGVKYMIQSGYEPTEMIAVMDVLKKASGGSSRPEFMSTHPDPENRKGHIMDAIEKYRGLGSSNSY